MVASAMGKLAFSAALCVAAARAAPPSLPSAQQRVAQLAAQGWVPGLLGPQSAPTDLVAGQTLLDSATVSTLQYYAFFIAGGNFSQITLSVTPLAGTPNLLAGFTPAVNSYFSSAATGIDFISVGRNDSAVLATCPPFWGANPPQPCVLFFAVDPGLRFANYSISVSDGSLGVNLLPDVPSLGQLNLNTSQVSAFYSFSVAQQGPAGVITFSLSPLLGFGRSSTPLLAVAVSSFPGQPQPDPNGNSSNYCAVATTGGLSGLLTIALNAQSPGACYCSAAAACTYLVGVGYRYGAGAPVIQQFSLTASTQVNAPRVLEDGVQNSGEGSANSGPSGTPLFVYNAVLDPATARAVRIIETPLTGAVNLYATLDGSVPTPTNFQYSAVRFSGENELVVRWSDPQVQTFCLAKLVANTTCPITIAAVILTQRASFNIVARQSAVFRLTPGVPVEDYVFPNRVTYYYMDDNNYGGTFEATIAPLSNQFVNLYVGSDAVNGTQFPDPNNTATYCYTTRGNILSPGVIIIPSTDRCFCAFSPCRYYVGVSTGFNSSATYSLLAKYLGGYQLLELNVPFVDALPAVTPVPAANVYLIAYPEAFNLSGTGGFPAASLNFNIDANPGSGQLVLTASICVLFVNCNFSLPMPPSQYAVTLPVGSTSGALTVASTDTQFQTFCLNLLNGNAPFNASCIVWFTVTADPTVQATAIYTLTPNAGARQLVDGQVATSRVQTASYAYFRYTVIDLTRPLKITVAALSGNPDLIVGVGFWPSLANNTFQSLTPGVEAITITWDSATLRNITSRLSLPFDVNIAVYGYEGPAQFTIEATANTVQQLSLGVVAGGSAGPLGFSYYFYILPANQTNIRGFRASVTPTSGSLPLILINTPANPGPNGFPLLPRCASAICTGTFTNFVASSLGSATPNYVDIDPSSAIYMPGVWLIAVYSSTPALFQIQITTLDTIQTLGDGIPFPGFLVAGNYSFFQLPVFGPKDLIRLTAIQTSGLPAGVDIFASTNALINRPRATDIGTTGIFASQTVGPNPRNVLTIPGANLTSPSGQDCANSPCTLFLSIAETNTRYQQPNISFSLTADIVYNGSFTSDLPAGTPVYGLLPSQNIGYYFLSVPTGANGTTLPVTITLSPVRFDVNIFVTLDGSVPAPGNSAFNSSTAAGVDYIYIDRRTINTASANLTVLTIRVAVIAGILPAGSSASYFISWTDNDPADVTQIFANQPATAGRLTANSFAYYFFSAGAVDPTTDVTFSLTANGGDVSLYMSRWDDIQNNTAFRPGPGANCANSTNVGASAEWIIIPSAGANPFPVPGQSDGYASQCRCTTYPCNYLLGVGCTTRQSCQFFLSAILGDSTPLLLNEGQSLTYPIQPTKTVYYFFNMSTALSQGRNVTITASANAGSPGNIYIWATNTFTPGLTDPSLLPQPNQPATYQWSSVIPGGPGPSQSAVISFGPNDPVFAGCGFTSAACPFLTFGISTDAPPGLTVTMRVAWFSDGGNSILLPLGTTSPLQGLIAGKSRAYTAFLADTSKDFVVFSTQTYGRVGITVDINPVPQCTIDPVTGVSCAAAIWSAITPAAGSAPTQITISAANPCASATGACVSNSTVWRRGPYYINVLALENSQYTMTAALNRVPVVLLDSFPVTTLTNNQELPIFDFPTQTYSFSPSFPIAFYVTAQGFPITLYVNQCRQGSCTTQSLLPGPGPGQAQASFTIQAGSTQVVTVSPGSPAFCTALQGSFCHYYVAVFPAGNCDSGAGCSAPFTLMAAAQSGAAPQRVTFDSIANQVTRQTATLPATGQLFEFYLDPATGPSTVVVELDSCGPGYPAMYGCNPDRGTCVNNFKPSPSSFTNFAFPANNLGRDFVAMPSVAAPAVFMQMLADPSTPGARPNYEMLVSARKAFYLGPGTTNGVYGGINLEKVNNASDVYVTWPQAVIFDTAGNVVATPSGATYQLYVAVGGFNATQIQPVVNSPCGLLSWLATTVPSSGSGFANVSGALNATITGLASAAYYEINVVARCDQACFQQALGPQVYAQYEEGLATASSFRLGAGGRSLQAGVPVTTVTQSSTYIAVNFESAANNRPPSNAPASQLPIIIGGSVGGAVFLCCLVGVAIYCCRRRKSRVPSENIKADDRAKRVAQLGLGAAAPTIAAPSPSASAAAMELSAARAAGAGGKQSFEPVAPGGAAGGNVAGWQ